MENEEIILETSDEAASIKTVTGWVSRGGRFWGNGPDSEKVARYHGATHRQCPTCSAPVPLHSYCHPCHSKKEEERYNAMERRKWNGIDPLYSQAYDEFCFDIDAIDRLCEVNGCDTDALRLIVCAPVYAKEIEPNEYYADDLPEDEGVPKELQKIFDELNREIREEKIILSWWPSKYAAVV